MASLLTSDQVNYLIWRYLQESGFRDSANSFSRDSKVDRLEELFGPRVRSGLLVYLIQRGLQYEEIAANVNRDGSIKKGVKPFQFLPAAPAPPVEEDEGVGTDNGHMEEEDEDDEDDSVTMQSKSPATGPLVTRTKKHTIEEAVNGTPKKKRKRATIGADDYVANGDAALSPGPLEELRVTNGRSVGIQAEDVIEITAADTLILGGGEEEEGVLFCAWNPVDPLLLATVGAQQDAQIWDISLDADSAEAVVGNVVSHKEPAPDVHQVRVTAIRWSPEGTRLATGSYHGQTRIWSTDGELEHRMSLHYAPIISLKWGRGGDLLLALSCDGKIVAWDTATGEPHRVFELTDGESATNIEWISSAQFLASGDKGGLHLFDMTADSPLLSVSVYAGEIECVEWDDLTETAATAGQDISLWHKPAKLASPSGTLKGHQSSIAALAWQPSPNNLLDIRQRILASASNDATVRLWDTLSHTCLRELQLHRDPIEKICFSPDGSRLASGARGTVIVWNAESGDVTHIYDRVRSRRKNGKVMVDDDAEISGISWDEGGVRLAIAEGPHQCAIVRLKKPLAVI